MTSTALVSGMFPFHSMMGQNQRNPNERKLRVALCGLGRYARILAKGLEESETCSLAGIITGTPEKAVSWKAKYNIPEANIYNYENFDEIAMNEAIDLVYVVLPNSMHKEYTIRAAEAGKHVIVEKPMAVSVTECKEMIDACNKAGVQLALGYRLHYEPNHLELMRLGQEKVFGQVRMIQASLGYSLAGIDPSDWHLKKALSGGGPLMNLGVYCIQCNRYVLGEEPISVTAQFAPVTMPELFDEVEEGVSWQLNFPNGVMTTSTTTCSYGIDRFYAGADKGFFELSPAISYGPFIGRSSEGPFDFPVINQQAAQLDGIAEYILAGKDVPLHIAGEEGLKDLHVIEGIYKAAKTGKKVSLI